MTVFIDIGKYLRFINPKKIVKNKAPPTKSIIIVGISLPKINFEPGNV